MSSWLYFPGWCPWSRPRAVVISASSFEPDVRMVLRLTTAWHFPPAHRTSAVHRARAVILEHKDICGPPVNARTLGSIRQGQTASIIGCSAGSLSAVVACEYREATAPALALAAEEPGCSATADPTRGRSDWDWD